MPKNDMSIVQIKYNANKTFYYLSINLTMYYISHNIIFLKKHFDYFFFQRYR